MIEIIFSVKVNGMSFSLEESGEEASEEEVIDILNNFIGQIQDVVDKQFKVDNEIKDIGFKIPKTKKSYKKKNS